VAVDTAAKRFSMISAGGERQAYYLPSSGGIDSASERSVWLFLYAGVSDVASWLLFRNRGMAAVAAMDEEG
jgi:hypothetical protein